MHTRSLSLGFFACALLLAPVLTSAATITIEQTTTFRSLGKWTLIQPSQTSIDGTADRAELRDQPAGRYTLIANPPAGTTTTMAVYKGGELLQTIDLPQVSFELEAESDVRVQVNFALTNFGTVGVNSNPSGVPFELTGPDDFKQSGVTPQSYEGMPQGHYSVRYMPTGCTVPPQRSDELVQGKSIYFSFTLQCSNFVPVSTSSESNHVTVENNGSTLAFVDVPKDAWFTPYIETVARRGIITGYKDSNGSFTGLFGPGNPVTLGELSKISHVFGDVDPQFAKGDLLNKSATGKWFATFIVSAEQRGWGVFQNSQQELSQPATRGQVVATLLQVMDTPAAWPKGGVFDDVKRNTPFAGAIETAASLKLVSGVNSGKDEKSSNFAPLAPITRAELSKLLVTFAEYREKQKAETSTK